MARESLTSEISVVARESAAAMLRGLADEIEAEDVVCHVEVADDGRTRTVTILAVPDPTDDVTAEGRLPRRVRASVGDLILARAVVEDGGDFARGFNAGLQEAAHVVGGFRVGLR